jgi:uncharacterized metal-binding protein
MTAATPEFSIQVDGVKGVCPAGERWAKDKIVNQRIPVLACEGPCVRGDIARLAANRVANEAPFARACFPEVVFVPHSAMARWVKEADQVVMIDGCFLKCFGRALNNQVDPEKITHIEALPLYNKYTDLFDMDDVPEAERKETAKQVADKILPQLRATFASRRAEPPADGENAVALAAEADYVARNTFDNGPARTAAKQRQCEDG